MPTKATRFKPYGYGRVQFFADLPGIRADLERGLTLQAAYDKRSKKLGIGYSSFRKLVARYADDARPTGTKPTTPNRQDSADERSGRKQAVHKAPRDHTGTLDLDRIRRFVKGD
jgi:hypothetical protein